MKKLFLIFMLGALVSQPMYNGILYIKNNWNRWFPTELKKTNYSTDLVMRKAIVTGKRIIPSHIRIVAGANSGTWTNTKKKPRERFDWSFAVIENEYILEVQFVEYENTFNTTVQVTEETYNRIQVNQWIKYWGNEHRMFADGYEKETFNNYVTYDKLYFVIPDCCPGPVPQDVTDIVIKAVTKGHIDRASLDETNSMEQITMRGNK